MPKFKNEFILTEELFVEQNYHIAINWCMIALVVCAAIFLLPGWWIWSIVTFVGAMSLAVVGICEQNKLQRLYQKQLADNQGVACRIVVEFFDTNIRMQTSYGDDETIPYAAIIKSKNRQNLILFVVDRGFYIPIKKDSFAVGALSTFQSAMSVRGL